jgi:hypothetical protein
VLTPLTHRAHGVRPYERPVRPTDPDFHPVIQSITNTAESDCRLPLTSSALCGKYRYSSSILFIVGQAPFI